MEADLSDTVRWHAGALWSKTDLESLNYSPAFPPTQGPNGSGFVSAFTTSPANPAVAAFLDQQGLPQSGGANGTLFRVTNVYYRPFGFIGNPRDAERGAGQGLAKNNAWRVSTGLEFDVSDNLTFNVDGTYWRSAREAYAPGIVGSRLQAALNGFGGANCTGTTAGANGCQWFNPFVLAGPENPSLDIANPYYVPGFENDPDLVAWLQVPNGTFQREEQWVADAVLSGGTGLELSGGEVAFAIGAQYRKNNFISRPLNDISNLDVNPCFIEGDLSCVGTPTDGVGPFIFLGGTRPTKLDQSVYALFAEVQLPVLDNLEVTAAVRYEDYGDPVGSTINPKAAFRFEATDWLTLRGSIGTTFRGPLASNVDDNFVTALQGLTAAGGNYKSVDIYGNPALDPETALTYNVGFIVNTGGLTFSTDFWTYDFKDQIVRTPADAIASSVATGALTADGTRLIDCSAPLIGLITLSGNTCDATSTGLGIARVRTQFVNGPDVKVRGLDLAANYDIDADFGVISIGANATWNLEYKTDDFFVDGVLVSAAYDAVGFGNYFRDPGTLPEWRANGYVNLNTGGLNLRYSVNYIDSVTDERCTADPCFVIAGVPAGSNYGRESGSYTQHDLVANYTLPVEFAEVQLTAAVLNIFDEEPAQAYLPLGYNPFIGNAIGRNFRLGIRTKF
ncbi:MAG: TonB-dependent receptor [Erythrobacter sp.]